MLETSALYRQIIADPSHWEEQKLEINGTTYGENALAGFSTRGGVFGGDNLTIGAAAMGSITATLRVENVRADQLSATIPRMAKIEPYTRLCRIYNGTEQHSEWLPQGKYWIDSRDASAWSTKLSLYGYDALAFAEDDYPSTSHAWPSVDIQVVNEIAQTIGVDVDSATTAIMSAGYPISLPTGYTMRETLGFIAAMYGGNFVMTKEGKLLLLRLNSLPSETNYLIDQNGEKITFGGVRILV